MDSEADPLEPEALIPPPPPVETATEAGGTHPTGMHCCYQNETIVEIAVILIDIVTVGCSSRKD